MDRRRFIKAMLGAGAWTVLADGRSEPGGGPTSIRNPDPDRYDFLMPRVKFDCTMEVGDRWNAFPGGERNLLLALEKVVRCRVLLPPDCRDDSPHHGADYQFNGVVDLTDMDELRKYPFLFMTSSGPYVLSDVKKQNLGRYLNEGGFLLMDDCVHLNRSLFYKSSYKILQEIFGAGAVKRIPNDHEVFHNVYDLSRVGLPYVQGEDFGARGLFVGERLAVFLSSTDIHCGWMDPGRSHAGESIQMGINIIMYSLSH